MSWDRIEYQETASCACGKGRLRRTTYREDDDWNRSRIGVCDETIECYDCAKKYHIEHLIQSFSQPKWEGDGIIDTTYLVENGYSIQHKISVQELRFNRIEEEIVSKYTKDELIQAIKEMGTVKYSTRLQLSSSQEIVDLYSKRHKKKSLQPIIDLVSECIEKYDSFAWNPVTIKEYYNKEKRLVEEGQVKIKEALGHAKKVEWKQI